MRSKQTLNLGQVRAIQSATQKAKQEGKLRRLGAWQFLISRLNLKLSANLFMRRSKTKTRKRSEQHKATGENNQRKNKMATKKNKANKMTKGAGGRESKREEGSVSERDRKKDAASVKTSKRNATMNSF